MQDIRNKEEQSSKTSNFSHLMN